MKRKGARPGKRSEKSLKIFSPRYLISMLKRLNFRRREECSTLIRWLEPKPGERILDVGCGDGYYDRLIAKSKAKVIGIDICKRRLSAAHRFYRSERTEFIHMNAEEMGVSEASFDRVISFCVLEHLCNDERAMQEISRSLKKGGHFVFSVDSLSNPGVTAAERTRHQQHYTVNNYYTMENLQEKLFRAGFDIEKNQYILTTPFALALARLSWKLDHLHKALAVFKMLGCLGLFMVWEAASLFSRQLTDHAKSGLTLLVHAKKR
jgi:ubiquinone/menaquinone biosynthesis C-methylase UbiE